VFGVADRRTLNPSAGPAKGKSPVSGSPTKGAENTVPGGVQKAARQPVERRLVRAAIPPR